MSGRGLARQNSVEGNVGFRGDLTGAARCSHQAAAALWQSFLIPRADVCEGMGSQRWLRKSIQKLGPKVEVVDDLSLSTPKPSRISRVLAAQEDEEAVCEEAVCEEDKGETYTETRRERGWRATLKSLRSCIRTPSSLPKSSHSTCGFNLKEEDLEISDRFFFLFVPPPPQMELSSGLRSRLSSSPIQTMQSSRRSCDSFAARASSVNFQVDAPTAVDYGRILGVNPSASKSELKAAYRKLALRFHPDVCKPGDKSEVNFMEVNRAYESLMALASSDNQGHQGYGYPSYNGESSGNNGFETAESSSVGQEDDPWASFLQSLVNGTHEELQEDYSSYYSNLKQYSKASRNRGYQYYQGNW